MNEDQLSQHYSLDEQFSNLGELGADLVNAFEKGDKPLLKKLVKRTAEKLGCSTQRVYADLRTWAGA